MLRVQRRLPRRGLPGLREVEVKQPFKRIEVPIGLPGLDVHYVAARGERPLSEDPLDLVVQIARGRACGIKENLLEAAT